MQISGLYVYGNTHYNQVQSVPVTPVKRIGRLGGIAEQEDRAKIAVTYKPDQPNGKAQELSESRQTEQIRKEYAGEEQINYNQSNPYEQARMVSEGSALLGMNFDVFA